MGWRSVYFNLVCAHNISVALQSGMSSNGLFRRCTDVI